MPENIPTDKYQPVLLLPNKSYPTFQLYAEAGNGKADVETVLKIAVLTTFEWLRQRFRALEVPDEFIMTAVADHEKVAIHEFSSFTINKGYKLEVVWLEEDRAWTMQLTEPDLGPDPGNTNQARSPVPGRLFETNIAYQIRGDKVVCGFKTIVSEPVTTGEQAEVFRLAIIKKLARHKSVGLSHLWGIVEQAHLLDKKAKIEQLTAWLRDKDRKLPAVIAIACARAGANAGLPELQDSKPDIDQMIRQMTHPSRLYNTLTLTADDGDDFDQEQNPHLNAFDPGHESDPCAEPEFSFDLDGMARHRVGLAIFFKLPLEQLERFNQKMSLNARPGEVFAYEPAALGKEHSGRLEFVRLNVRTREEYDRLDHLIGNYPRGKNLEFGSVLFLAEAKRKHQERMIAASSSKEDIISALGALDEKKEQDHQQRLDAVKEELAAAIEKCKRQQEIINGFAEKERVYQEKLAAKDLKLEISARQLEQFKERFRLRKNAPTCLADVEGWVAQHFAGRLILHSRACDMLRSVSDSEVDIKLICDALEYLANEYRDCKLGIIDETKRNILCTQLYNRPFDVAATGEKSIEQYPQHYKIKYYTGVKGKPVESALDHHLRIGNKNENLLRIYFLYDKEKQRIVVGSLPKHLKTSSYR